MEDIGGNPLSEQGAGAGSPIMSSLKSKLLENLIYPQTSEYTSQDQPQSGRVLLGRAGPSYNSRQEEPAATSLGDDVESIRKTCNYISNIVTNFHVNQDQIPDEAKKFVMEMDSKLLDMALNKGIQVQGEPGPSVKPKQPKFHSDHHDNKHGGAETETEQDQKPRFQRKNRNLQFSSSDSSPEISRSSRRRGRIFTNTNRGSNADNSVSMVHMVEALRRFDTRLVPKPEAYNLESGLPFETYLELFEEYCESTFKGSSSLWVSELGRLLSGPIREAYHALKVPGESYESLKVKLIRWCSDSKDNVTRDIRKKFEKARMNPGESFRLYAARLEGAFRLAYPNKNPAKSATLRRKFLESIPKTFRKQLSTAGSLLAMQGRELSWNEILIFASRQDVDMEASDYESAADHPSVWVSTSPSILDKDKSADSKFPSNTQGSRSKIPESEQYESRTCDYCNIKGHIKANCMRFNKLCFVCGSRDHRISQCPHKRDESSRQRSTSPTSSRRPSITRKQSRSRRERQVSFQMDDDSGSGNSNSQANLN